MTREELIEKCKYYKGEKVCPFENSDNKSYLWWLESKWTEAMLSNDSALKGFEEMYKKEGLTDFRKDDNTPLSLKAFLFGRYCYFDGTTEGMAPYFKKWYNENY